MNKKWIESIVLSSSFMTNSEWDLVSYSVEYHEGWEPMGNYTELVFSLHVRRRPWFMLLNTVLPTAFIRYTFQSLTIQKRFPNE